MSKQTCFDPLDPAYDGPEDDEDDVTEDFGPDSDDYDYDEPADDYIMTDRELRGEL